MSETIASLKDILDLNKHCLYLTQIDVLSWGSSIKLGFIKSHSSPENGTQFWIKLNGCITTSLEFLGGEPAMNDLVADVIACNFDENLKQVRIHCDVLSILVKYQHFEYKLKY